MDDKIKARILVMGFFVFTIMAAMLIGSSREKITGASVTEDCRIECSSNADCDDGNENTLDGCAYPGSCASKCFYEDS